jgi:hypothetical protein
MHVGVAQCVKDMDTRVTMDGWLVILDALFMHVASRTSGDSDSMHEELGYNDILHSRL